ncbi:unnamed protein product [Sphenostylis stenocarpa]|uniref:Cysteine-rich receptor-like protein kinase 2 n=1 Tax=Sphenostylis stenocarpa TaxID=92480 RepID=A0AA86SZ49_9FABA|nr:unnamed protein product [Sphenostylis stenocarpa]
MMLQQHLKLVPLTLFILWSLEGGALGDPQTRLLNKGCSQYNASDLTNFNQNLNATLDDLRVQVSNQSKHFATAQAARGQNPVYGMFQCRNYLSTSDCAACFSVAAFQIRNCSAGANGARVIYDGCFLRYESSGFFDQTTLPGNSMTCGNQTAVGATDFNTTALQVLMDLQIATPKIAGFFAATKTQLAGGAIYAIAQCAETVSESGCLDCLTVGYNNLRICLPNTEGRAFDAGCFMRYSDTAFFADNQTIDITPFLQQGGSSKKGAIIGGVVGGVGLVVILLALYVLFKRYKKPKEVRRGNILGATELKGPVSYRYKDLKTATENFSDENKLGEGGFGNVYKGTLKNGKIVAVKKLFLGQSGKMDEQFESEVKLISNVHHKNLVRLLGCCSKGQERILVYEYMANKSLDRFLFGEQKGSLNWNQRYVIILGTAKGLAYLHEDFHVCIIHRDIKTSNILLDDEMQPRIADFGLARLLPEDQSHLSTRFAGTLGYTAPEYAIHGQLSEKADAYSFGVVVLEIISGQKNSELREDANGEFLLRRAWRLYEEDLHLELLDKTLNPEEYEVEEVKKIIEIALLCTQASAGARPTMSEIVALLKSKNSIGQIRPSMPVFVESNLRTRATETSTSTGSSTSKATFRAKEGNNVEKGGDFSSTILKETNLLNKGCSAYNASNLPSFFANINETFASLRAQISSDQTKHFAIEDKARGEVLTYAMFRCRNYLSNSECLTCFNTATSQIRNCSAANGARIIYDSCFLRFYDETNEPGGGVSCGNTSSIVTGFRVGVQQVLMELQKATPKIGRFYAATKTPVVGGSAIYAVSQCVETTTKATCLKCMQEVQEQEVGTASNKRIFPTLIKNMVQLKLLDLTLLVLWSWWSLESTIGDPQLFFLKSDCSGFIAPNLANFNQNLNASLDDLTAQVSNQSKHFATAKSTTGADPVYAMFQCRNYLSITDCATCLATATAKIRNCSAGVNGARVIYDGCFLRYTSIHLLFDQPSISYHSELNFLHSWWRAKVLEFRVEREHWNFGSVSGGANGATSFLNSASRSPSCPVRSGSTSPIEPFGPIQLNNPVWFAIGLIEPLCKISLVELWSCLIESTRYESNDFFDQIMPRSSILCGNQTANESTAFSAAGQQVLMDLQTATPKITGFYAATKTQVVGGAIYAFAQCAETISQSNCLDCLSVERSSIQGCLPYTNARAFDAGCFMRYSESPFFADNQTIDISPFLKQGGSSSKKWVIIGVVVGGAALVVILLLLFSWCRRPQSPKRVARGNILEATELKGPKKYKYSDLKAATRNFSEKNKVGEGGFGAVYKGTMKNGKVIAVKILISGKSSKINDDFETEVTLISNVHHRNLVRLLGCCSKDQDRILVYEFMANSSLDNFLFGKRKGFLNWKQRYDIILGTARGLTYLHEEFHVTIIHRDIKSGNILLDEELQPKISDFGLVKLLPGDQSHLSTRFAGTMGYTAPEYALNGQLSEKADIYSYGIVVLEIISGQKSTDVKCVDDDAEDEYLLRRAWKLYERGMQLELVDKSLNPNDYDAEEVKKVIDIALLCTQPSSATRPAMSEVVALLSSNDLLEHMRPTMPIFIESKIRPHRDIFASTGSSTSNGTASNSIVPAQ